MTAVHARWLQYQTDPMLDRFELSYSITEFLSEFSEEDFALFKITIDIWYLRQIALVLKSNGSTVCDYYQVEIYFRELANTLIGSYFINYFISETKPLSKANFYNYIS